MFARHVEQRGQSEHVDQKGPRQSVAARVQMNSAAKPVLAVVSRRSRVCLESEEWERTVFMRAVARGELRGEAGGW